MNIYSIATLTFSVCSAMVGMVVQLQRGDKLSRRFLLFCVLAAIWGFTIALHFSESIDSAHALFFARVANAAGLLVPMGWLAFVIEFADVTKKARIFQLISIVIALCVLPFSFTSLFIVSVSPKVGISHYVDAGPLHAISFLHYIFVVSVGFYFLIRKYRKSDKVEKRKIFFLITGTAIGFFSGGLAFLPCYGLNVPQFALVFLPLFPFLIAYGISKERLFDVGEIALRVHADKVKSLATLAASINHEVKNPLYGIRSQGEAFFDKAERKLFKNTDETVRTAVLTIKEMHSQSVRAIQIIQKFSMLAKCKLSDDRVVEKVNVLKVVEGIKPLLAYEFETERIEFHVDIDPFLPEVHINRREFEQILLNLMRNGVQAINNGGRINISATQDQHKMEIFIRDDGSGISDEGLEKIFEPFYTTKLEGTGLGLYITRQLVERNGGTISVSSELNVGTVFKIEMSLGINE